MKAITLELEPYQIKTLEQMRDHHAVPYLREKAAALLKIASGKSIVDVAQHGLLKERKTETVRGWVKAYNSHGIGGLYQLRRRQRAFSPTQVGELQNLLVQSPENFGLGKSRWQLALVSKQCPWLKHYSPSGVWRVLQFLKVYYKRGQQHIHSPDPNYQKKGASPGLRTTSLGPSREYRHFVFG